MSGPEPCRENPDGRPEPRRAVGRRATQGDEPGLSSDQRQALRDWLAADDPGDSPARGYQASVRIYRGPAGAFAIKEPEGRGLRAALGRAAIRREAKVYRRLRGIPGIPRCFGCLDGRCLVLEYIPGETLHAQGSELAERAKFFAKLLETLAKMHAAGVAHGDLKRRKNILVGPGERPFVIDFGIAVTTGGRKGFLFDLVRQADRNAWIKHKYRGQMQALAAEDAALYRPMRMEAVMRAMRVVWRTLSLRRWRKKRSA